MYFAVQSDFELPDGGLMQDLNKALSDISNIRRQVARTTEFRGYGPATLAATACFAIAAACAQARWIPDPAVHFPAYLSTWISTALVSAALIGAQMHTRSRRIHSGMADEMIWMAVEQFLPAVGAGALITAVVVAYAPGVRWLLPAFWQITFSLGVFSSCRFLPRPMIAAGAWYMFTGLSCIVLGESRALSPWAMGIPYGAGQLLVAAVLLATREEPEDES